MPSALPGLRLLVLGDFRGRPERDFTRYPIDKQRFEETLARLSPSLAFSVGVGGGGGPPQRLDVKLGFRSLRDFAPPALAQAIPQLESLGKARGLVTAARRGEITPEALAEGLPASIPRALRDALLAPPSEPPPAPHAGEPAAPAGDLDNLLSMVETKETPGGPARESARRMVDALTPSRGAARRAPSPATDAALAGLDAHAAEILDAVLHAPPFRALEATWRGLKLLVDRTDFRQGISLELVSARADEAPAALEQLAEGEDVDVVLADHALSATAHDVELASSLASAAENAQTPFACAVSPEFLGLASWAELQRGRMPQAVFDEAPYAAWRSLREREASRWIVLLANRIALRGAYGPEGVPVADFSYREARPAGLCGSPVWALGSVLAQAFARSGACLQISGALHGAVLDLPLLSGADGADPAPVEGRFSSERREDLERIGLTVVQHHQRDSAVLGAARSFHRPERYPDADASADAAQQVTLAYQIFASRLVKGLGGVLPELAGVGSAEALIAGLREAAIRLVSTPQQPLDPQRVGIALEPDPDDGALTRVALRVQPDFMIAGRPVNVMLRFRLAL